MPIYAYKCESCAHAKDVLQKISDPLLTVCPACGQATFKKQLTAAGFQLKGSGWYVTDFKGGAAAGAVAPGKTGSEGDSAKGDAKSDTKTAESGASSPASPSSPSTSAPASSGTSAAPAPSAAKPAAPATGV
jgi:putative FmdB family regulatory protein